MVEEEFMRRSWQQFAAPLAALVMILSAASCQSARVGPGFAGPPPKNVIVMISDGMGPAAVTLTRLVSARESLTLDEYLIGTRRTSSENRIVTDSAAAATAIATGHRTKNDYVGVTPDVEPLGNVLEAAKFQKKMATGLVVKAAITDATPGGFSAHVKTRADQDRIALQQLGLRADVMFGGGSNRFLPTNGGGTRKDGRDLLAEARDSGYQVITSAEGLAGDLHLPVIGLFAKGTMHYAIDRSTTQEPSLPEMTRKALELLSQRPEGFFLMIEGSEIDHTAHVNDGRTLVVSTSDHETGGLTITGGEWTGGKPGPQRLRANKASADAMVTMIKNGAALTDVLREYASVTNVTEEEKAAYEAATPGNPSDLQKRRTIALSKIINARAGIKWSVPDHSAVDVNVYAYGPGQELFRGARPATWMATGVAQVLGLDLEEATREARARIKGDVGKTAATAEADD
jgi:alkaline phosphatase